MSTLSTRTKILAAVGALAVLVIALSRGGPVGEDVQALENDPMALYAPPGGTLIDTEKRDVGLERPVEARLTRLFQLQAGSGERALDSALDAARASDWTLTQPATDRAFVAVKKLPSGKFDLTVTRIEDARLLPDGAKPPALSVSLRRLGE